MTFKAVEAFGIEDMDSVNEIDTSEVKKHISRKYRIYEMPRKILLVENKNIARLSLSKTDNLVFYENMDISKLKELEVTTGTSALCESDSKSLIKILERLPKNCSIALTTSSIWLMLNQEVAECLHPLRIKSVVFVRNLSLDRQDIRRFT